MMKNSYFVFILIVIVSLFVSSCALKEIEVKASPSIQTPITKDVILLTNLIDIETIENTLKESFQSYVHLTRISNLPLAYNIEAVIFEANEILEKLNFADFEEIPTKTYSLVTSDSSKSLISFSEINLGILENINFISLPATFLIKGTEGVTVEATLTYGNEGKLKMEQNKVVDVSDLINSHEDIKIEEMSIRFDAGFFANEDTSIEMIFELPFKFQTTQDIELYNNRSKMSEEDIFGRIKDSKDDLKDIIEGINSLKVHVDYLNTTGLFFKIKVQGWDVKEGRETYSNPIERIIFNVENTVVFDLKDFIKEIKEIIPYNFLISIYLSKSDNDSVYELNLDGEVEYIIWFDLGIDIHIPIKL